MLTPTLRSVESSTDARAPPVEARAARRVTESDVDVLVCAPRESVTVSWGEMVPAVRKLAWSTGVSGPQVISGSGSPSSCQLYSRAEAPGGSETDASSSTSSRIGTVRALGDTAACAGT